MTASAASPFDLTGRRILVAGAAGGIGSATAKLCARQGATLILVDIVGKDRIRERVGAELADRSEIYSLDTGSRADVTAMAKHVGAIYGLVDTAAIAPHDDWMAEDWEESLDRVIRANIKGPINLARAFLPGMMDAGEGRIVLCGSVAGWMGGLRTGPHYAFAKGGIHSFTRWLAGKAVARNVLVNGIAPGPVETAMTDGKGYDVSLYPLKRMAKAEEIAATAVFLCSPGSGYATGAIFDINGGTHLR